MSQSDKFTWSPGDVAYPQCSLCKHLDPGCPTAICAAFPGHIPDEIGRNEVDHRKPWIDPETGEPGDMGIALEHSILFEPIGGVSPATLAALYRHLDKLP